MTNEKTQQGHWKKKPNDVVMQSPRGGSFRTKTAPIHLRVSGALGWFTSNFAERWVNWKKPSESIVLIHCSNQDTTAERLKRKKENQCVVYMYTVYIHIFMFTYISFIQPVSCSSSFRLMLGRPSWSHHHHIRRSSIIQQKWLNHQRGNAAKNHCPNSAEEERYSLSVVCFHRTFLPNEWHLANVLEAVCWGQISVFALSFHRQPSNFLRWKDRNIGPRPMELKGAPKKIIGSQIYTLICDDPYLCSWKISLK